MNGKEGLLPRIKDNISVGARTLSAAAMVGGFSAGFNPSSEVSADSHTHESGTHLFLEKSPFDSNSSQLSGFEELDLSNLKPDISTEDVDKIAQTLFVSAYMIGVLAQVRKNLEIARRGEKRFGWGGAAVQTLSAAYGLARIWEADFGDIQDELDKTAISGFIAGYISTKGALTLRSMSNGLPWTKAVAESGFGTEAAAGVYAIARVTEVIK